MSREQRIGLIVAALSVAAVAFVLLRPGDEDAEKGGKRAATTPTAEEAIAPAEPKPKPRQNYELVTVEGGKPKGGVKEIKVEKGDTARVRVKSDTADEVHVHGYDLSKAVEEGGSVRFKFSADIEGVFEIELEGSHTPVATLVVEP